IALRAFTPLALTGLRVALSTACMWPVVRWTGETMAVPRRDVLPLLGMGFLLNTAFHVGLNASLVFTTPAHASLAVGTMPIFAAVAARLLLGERLTRRRLAAILLAFAGVALVIAAGRGLAQAPHAALGDLLALGAAASWALGSVFSKPFLLRYSPLKFTALTMAAGAATGIPCGSAALLRLAWAAVPWTGWLALAYLAVLSMAVANFLWNRAVARTDVAQVAIFSNLIPVAALVLSALLYGEPVTPPLVAGGALVVAGAYLTQRT
ncbi:MAG TPA: DMT family transporter, partial [Candidatus Sulfotelmatobacter sp.]|nr:DMT family transporter [Candidatus Sulfotelmatobacter sp.]